MSGFLKTSIKWMQEKFSLTLKIRHAHQLGALPYEIGDPNYVRNLKLKFKPTGNISPEMQANYNNFCELIDRKHFVRGYRGDLNFVNEMSDMYGLKANDHLQSLKDIKIRRIVFFIYYLSEIAGVVSSNKRLNIFLCSLFP